MDGGNQIPAGASEDKRVLLARLLKERQQRATGGFIHRLEQRAAESPDLSALICPDGRHLTYGELNNRANHLAKALAQLNLSLDARVGICGVDPDLLLLVLVAAVKSRLGVFLISPDMPDSLMKSRLSSASVLVGKHHQMDAFPNGSVAKIGLDPSASYDVMENPNPQGHALATAWVGQSSGVDLCISYGAMNHRLEWLCKQFPLNPDDRFRWPGVSDELLIPAAIFWPLSQGATIVACCDQKVSVAFSDSASRIRLQHGPPPQDQAGLGSYAFDLAEAGGEITLDASGNHMGVAVRMALFVLDDKLQLTPGGDKGRLFSGGGGLARAYDRRPALTALHFIPHPYAKKPGARLYTAPDRVRRHGESVEILPSPKVIYRQNRRINLELLSEVLGDLEPIRDFALEIRTDQNHQRTLVLWLVSNEDDFAFIEEHIGKDFLPDVTVNLRKITRKSGRVDWRMLHAMPVVDADVLKTCRSMVVQVEGVLDCFAANRVEVKPDTPSVEKSVPVTSDKPAFTPGPPLVLSDDEPFTLLAALDRAADQGPSDAMTFIQNDGVKTIRSYTAIRDSARRILSGLRGLGLQPGDKALFLLEKNQDFAAGFWACLMGGFVPVPLSIPKSFETTEAAVAKWANAWDMLGQPITLTGRDHHSALLHLAAQFEHPFRFALIEDMLEYRPDLNPHPAKPDDLAILLLTSGSTGKPKAVMQSHRALLARSIATARLNQFGSEDISLNWMPLDHVGGVVMFHVRDVVLCSRQVHVPTSLILENPLLWLDFIETYRATITWAPNFAYALVNDQADQLGDANRDLSSLRFILNAGEAIVCKTIRRFMNLLAPHGLRSDAMKPSWGMSETSSAVTFSHRFRQDITSDDDSFVPVGGPIPGFDMRIVDPANKSRVLMEGQSGALQVRGLSVTSGYFLQDDLNEQVFHEGSWFDTGDLGMIKDGQLTITGREKDVIIVHGVNWFCHEIESVVEDVPGVAVSFAAAFPYRAVGSDTDQLIVIFSPKDKNEVDVVKDIRTRLVHHCGLNPAHIIPVEREEIPKTSIGKIQRNLLRKRFEAGLYTHLTQESESAVEEGVDVWVQCFENVPAALGRLRLQDRFGNDIPTRIFPVAELPYSTDNEIDVEALRRMDVGAWRPSDSDDVLTGTEKILVEIWSRSLKRDRIGIYDNFFELGGHSILLAQTLGRINREMGPVITMPDMFQRPTIAEQAAFIDNHEESGLDLDFIRKDAVLPGDIIPAELGSQQCGRVLLTGATGFVGAFLLDHLLKLTDLKVSCIIRAKDQEQASQRLQQTLATYQLEPSLDRVAVLPGDLASSGEALNRIIAPGSQFDAIYHLAASVHMGHGYPKLRKANVLGTLEVIRFAVKQGIPLHFISTLGVFADMTGEKVSEDAFPSDPPVNTSGYGQTKWVAESLVRQAAGRGLPVSIYRLGRIAGDRHNGAVNRTDFLAMALKTCMDLRLAPELDFNVRPIPADFAAASIYNLSLQPPGVWHLTHDETTNWSQLIGMAQQAGYEMALTTSEQWRTALETRLEQEPNNATFAAIAGLTANDSKDTSSQEGVTVNNPHTRQVLEFMGLRCPAIDHSLVRTWLDFLS